MTDVLLAPEAEQLLSWELSDVERRLGFAPGRFTQVNSVLTFVSGRSTLDRILRLPYVCSRASLGRVHPTRANPIRCRFSSFMVAFHSGYKVAEATIAASRTGCRDRAGRSSVRTFSSYGTYCGGECEIPRSTIPTVFLLLNRILVALSNLKNIGRIGDVDEILRSQADREESMMETSYALLRGFIWAVPVLGFIGTVLGLSGAIGSFGSVLQEAGDFHAITAGLQNITAGLATAFETTLVALVAALFLQIILTFLKEERRRLSG